MTVVDHYSRESPAISVNQGFKGADVIGVPTLMEEEHGSPKTINLDYDAEFFSKERDRWLCENRVELDFSQPNAPIGNADMESLHGRFRQQCLTMHGFLSLDDARCRTEAWRAYDNETPHHPAFACVIPAECTRQSSLL